MSVRKDVIMTPNIDILFNVLSLLPTKSLVRFKSVSKEWQSLISENGFAKIQLKTREPTSGFLFQERYKWSTGDISTINYISTRQGGFKQAKMFDFLPEDIVLLSTCNGLVFSRSCFKCYPQGDLFLYICNPLNKEWITVENVEPDRILVIALAFDPERDLVDNTTHFKLVRVQEFETEMEQLCYSFEIYSSRTGSWKKSQGVCSCEDNLCKNDGFYIGGSLHWMTDGNQILTYNVESDLSWLVSVPIPATRFEGIHAACIGVAEGKLHYVSVSDLGFQVWSLEDYFDSRWSLKHSKSLEAMEIQHPKSLSNLHARVKRQRTSDTLMVAPLSFSDGFLLLRVRKKFFMYNFELDELCEVCSEAQLCANSMYHPVVLPYIPSLLSPKCD